MDKNKGKVKLNDELLDKVSGGGPRPIEKVELIYHKDMMQP